MVAGRPQATNGAPMPSPVPSARTATPSLALTVRFVRSDAAVLTPPGRGASCLCRGRCLEPEFHGAQRRRVPARRVGPALRPRAAGVPLGRPVLGLRVRPGRRFGCSRRPRRDARPRNAFRMMQSASLVGLGSTGDVRSFPGQALSAVDSRGDENPCSKHGFVEHFQRSQLRARRQAPSRPSYTR
jgi:hypothetical protein